jgi:hypothetical protein
MYEGCEECRQHFGRKLEGKRPLEDPTVGERLVMMMMMMMSMG